MFSERKCIFIVILLTVTKRMADAECHNSFYGQQDKIYVWSDDKTNANSAQQTCMTSGGNLLQSRSGTDKDGLITMMQQKYNNGLVTVNIQQNPNIPQWYKFRSTGRLADKEDISRWNRPPHGEMQTFELYPSSNQQYSTEVRFCYFNGRDQIRFSCDVGWNNNFILYGGTSTTSETVLLRGVYSYLRLSGSSGTVSDGGSTKIITSQDPVVFTGHEEIVIPFFIPDHSVFIGARSDVGKINWFWSDGTMVTDPDYPTSNARVCQQMSWPLTYDNRINLLSKQCTEDRAYFFCEFKFTASLMPEQCNASLLHLTWNRATFDGIVGTPPNFVVEVTILEDSRNPITLPYNVLHSTIDGLQKQTNYTVVASLKMEGCQTFSVETTVRGRTSYGLPDPVTKAFISNSTSSRDCVVEWQHDPSDEYIIAYGIFITTNDLVSRVERRDLINIGQLTRHLVDLSALERSITVQFQIRAISCEGESEAVDVEGSCVTPLELPSTPPPSTTTNSTTSTTSTTTTNSTSSTTSTTTTNSTTSTTSTTTTNSTSSTTSTSTATSTTSSSAEGEEISGLVTWICIGVAGFVVVVILVLGFILIRRYKKSNSNSNNMEADKDDLNTRNRKNNLPQTEVNQDGYENYNGNDNNEYEEVKASVYEEPNNHRNYENVSSQYEN